MRNLKNAQCGMAVLSNGICVTAEKNLQERYKNLTIVGVYICQDIYISLKASFGNDWKSSQVKTQENHGNLGSPKVWKVVIKNIGKINDALELLGGDLLNSKSVYWTTQKDILSNKAKSANLAVGRIVNIPSEFIVNFRQFLPIKQEKFEPVGKLVTCGNYLMDTDSIHYSCGIKGVYLNHGYYIAIYPSHKDHWEVAARKSLRNGGSLGTSKQWKCILQNLSIINKALAAISEPPIAADVYWTQDCVFSKARGINIRTGTHVLLRKEEEHTGIIIKKMEFY